MQDKLKTSLITTTLNEGANILDFLNSIKNQSIEPDEIIIVDAASSDQTAEIIKKFDLKINLIIKKSNRSEGRNFAIKQAKNELILVSDAGNILDKNWIEFMIQPFEDKKIDVVGGWYQPLTKNSWQEALAKVLNFKVTDVNPETFLPSSRSLAFKKSIWQKAGGYPKNISTTSEDTIFDLNLKKIKAKFYFQPKAIVHWEIDDNYKALYKRTNSYAYTDGLNNLVLSQYKILSIFLLINILLIGFGFWGLALLFILIYLFLPFWQAKKIDNIKEVYQVPLIKLTIVIANLMGYIKGLLKL